MTRGWRWSHGHIWKLLLIQNNAVCVCSWWCDVMWSDIWCDLMCAYLMSLLCSTRTIMHIFAIYNTHSFTHSLTYTLTHSFTHSLTHSLTHINCCGRSEQRQQQPWAKVLSEWWYKPFGKEGGQLLARNLRVLWVVLTVTWWPSKWQHDQWQRMEEEIMRVR